MAPSFESWTLTTQLYRPPSGPPNPRSISSTIPRTTTPALPHPHEGPASRHCSVRGKGIMRPEQPREPKQLCYAQAAHAWTWAIAEAALKTEGGPSTPGRHARINLERAADDVDADALECVPQRERRDWQRRHLLLWASGTQGACWAAGAPADEQAVRLRRSRRPRANVSVGVPIANLAHVVRNGQRERRRRGCRWVRLFWSEAESPELRAIRGPEGAVAPRFDRSGAAAES